MAAREGGATALASLRGLAGACHPAPTAAVTLVAVLLSVAVGLPAGTVAVVGAAVLTGQLSIGWSNDRIDAARDTATARRDKPAAAGGVALSLVSLAAGLALAATVGLSLALGLAAAVAALLLVAAGWAYNLGLKATVFSGLTYVVGFGALPAVPWLARAGGGWPPWWAPAAGALLGLGAHIANVLPDLRDDEATGVRGLPHRLGPRRALLVLAASLAGAAVVLGIGEAGRAGSSAVTIAVVIATVGVAAAVAVVVLARRRAAAGFRLTLLLAVADVAVLVALSW